MSQRGRKSRASLSVVPVIPGARTPAPVELDEAESRIWDAVLRSMRQDWYSPAIAPLLRAYCTECVTAELLERKLRELREFSPSDPYSSAQVTLVEDDDVIETLTTDRANDALDVGILPG